ncbi:2-dehydropantoate 2-reductase N-terminal domain-containing protein [Tessaracoccus sp. MC1756]|uniref:NAD(P)H-dependent glycerol-3-phosphate dehydrogenase n=1 Tax=Tessaracoccus sp. MC1756 TaxID=2760311 RepID=UPI0015FFDB83|nr:2-dehydropantoate 2-reductase N-terminal domain-containing protein [Tessaracoccus sp. MC1756]MBB1508416.1 glycerol-3-phosphate dehydrogenase [Tessaracoccus sp. MC1756]
MATIAVLGAGIMASALATPLADNGHTMRLVGTHLDREIIDSIKSTGVHPNLGLTLPEGTTAYQLEEAADAFDGIDLVLSGVNSFGVHWAGQQLATLLRPGMHVIALAKGMEADDEGNLTILPRVLAGEVPDELRSQVTFSAIAGPSIAGEVAVRRHTSVVFTGDRQEVLDMWRGLFATEAYHVWTNTDFVGVEVCAATKNCYAFGAGFMSGILDAMGDTAGERYVNFNYGAALFGQASIEMIQFMDLLGGSPTTPLGLPGIGDCFVTSMGGRNVKCGRLVGSGLTFSQARDQMPGVTLEGAAAIAVIGEAMVKLTDRGIVAPEKFPLLRHLYEVVGLDRQVNVPWDSFFGSNGSGS